MKLIFQVNLDSMGREDGDVIVTFKNTGRAVDTKLVNAKDVVLEGSLRLKSLLAKDIKIGSKLKVEVSVLEEGDIDNG